MSRIIGGVKYDTDTACLVARAEDADDEWPRGGDERYFALYQTPGGAFFLHNRVTSRLRRSRYDEWDQFVRDKFEPMTREEAEKWVNHHGQVELLNADVFEEQPEPTG